MGGPATSQGGVWIRIASSQSHRQSWPAHGLSPSLAWCALCLLADAPMLPGWDAAARGHWVQLPRDPRPLPQKAGERRPQAKTPGPSGGSCSCGTWPPTGCCCCTALSVGKLIGPQACDGAIHAWWRRAPYRHADFVRITWCQECITAWSGGWPAAIGQAPACLTGLAANLQSKFSGPECPADGDHRPWWDVAHVVLIVTAGHVPHRPWR